MDSFKGLDLSNTDHLTQGLARQIRDNEAKVTRDMQSIQKRDTIRERRAEVSKVAAVETAAELKALRDAIATDSKNREKVDKRNTCLMRWTITIAALTLVATVIFGILALLTKLAAVS
jgi:hypothetical protein